MFDSLNTGAGLDAVLALQATRNDFFDIVVRILDLATGNIFLIAFIGFIYLALDKRLAWRLYFVLIVTNLVIVILKDTIGSPRPFMVSDAVMPLLEAEGNGVPSGHSALAVAMWGVLVVYWRNRWVTLFVVVHALLQGYGRVYAGMHYPHDVLTGWLTGALVLAVTYPLIDRTADQLNRLFDWRVQMALVLAVGVVLGLLVSFSEDGLTTVGILIGGGWAAILEPRFIRFSPLGPPAQRAIRFVGGFAMAVAVLLGLSALLDGLDPEGVWRVVRYGVVAFLALAIVPFVALRMGLAHADDDAPPADVREAVPAV